MAKEVMLVPKEKYQKLLESHKRSMNNRNEENISNMDINTLKQREVGGLHDINMEIENKKKVNSDIECLDVHNYDNQSKVANMSVKPKQENELKDTNSKIKGVHEEMGDRSPVKRNLSDLEEKPQSDTDHEDLHNNQSVTEKNIQTNISDNDSTKLAVYKKVAHIIKRKEKLPSKKKNVFKKRWLKYN